MTANPNESPQPSAIAGVYAGPLEDFVRRRDALAKELRAAGDRDAAAIVKALRKPTRTAWALNLGVQEDPRTMDALVDAVAAVIDAQAAGGDVRAAITGMRAAVRELADAAVRAAEPAGHNIEVGALVNSILAILGSPESFEQLRGGRLADIPEAGSLDFLAGLPAPVASAAVAVQEPRAEKRIVDRRIAVIADIHGNTIALDAVLADARAVGVDELWFIGDFCAIGADPAGVIDRVLDTAARCTRGNTDRYVVTGEGPPPDVQTVARNPALIPLHAAIAASFAWTRGYLTARDRLDWLEKLPLEIRVTAGRHRIVAVHAAPGTDDGAGVHRGRSNAELASLLAGSGADLVLVGHTHEPMVRRVDNVTLVNVGAVSNPRAPDLRACYAVLEIGNTDPAVKHRRVEYDHGAYIESVRRSRHPAAEFILSYQRGEHPGSVPHADDTPDLFDTSR